MEIATGKGIPPGSVGLAQDCLLTKPPYTRNLHSAGRGTVTVHPILSGVGSRDVPSGAGLAGWLSAGITPGYKDIRLSCVEAVIEGYCFNH